MDLHRCICDCCPTHECIRNFAEEFVQVDASPLCQRACRQSPVRCRSDLSVRDQPIRCSRTIAKSTCPEPVHHVRREAPKNPNGDEEEYDYVIDYSEIKDDDSHVSCARF